MKDKYGVPKEVDQADLIEQAKKQDLERQRLQDQRQKLNEKILTRKRK